MRCLVRFYAAMKAVKIIDEDRRDSTMYIKQDTTDDDNNHHLSQMGWTSHFQRQLEHLSNDGFIPARVVGVRKNSFRTSNGKREWLATPAGKLKHDACGMYPVTGDWVLMTDAVISRVLVRKNALSRGRFRYT